MSRYQGYFGAGAHTLSPLASRPAFLSLFRAEAAARASLVWGEAKHATESSWGRANIS